MAAVIDYLDHVEIGLCHRINRLGRKEAVRRFFEVISRLGDYGFWVASGIGLLLLQGSEALPDILRLGVTAVAGVAIYKLLKRTLIRERPFIASGNILCGAAPLDRYSFPSGHTLHAVSFTIQFANLEPAFLYVCAPFAVLVAVSRVILGLHYPSDVVVGAALGASIAQVSIALA